MAQTIIDANNAVLGRLASTIAERILKGERIVVVNAERAIVNGTRGGILRNYERRKELRAKGNPFKGPKFFRMPDALVKHAIVGMLPMKSKRGLEAARNIKVYNGMPKQFEGKEVETISNVLLKRKKYFMRIGQISTRLGAKF